MNCTKKLGFTCVDAGVVGCGTSSTPIASHLCPSVAVIVNTPAPPAVRRPTTQTARIQPGAALPRQNATSGKPSPSEIEPFKAVVNDLKKTVDNTRTLNPTNTV
jgi:hypothetical protein